MLVVLVIMMFFGTDKLPVVVKALGKGIKEMKNATAEIQREIEKGSAEIQRDLNLQKEMSELQEASDKISKRLRDGLKDMETHYDTKETPTETKEISEPEKENPLVPPDAVKRED